jgi:hypothetical protein
MSQVIAKYAKKEHLHLITTLFIVFLLLRTCRLNTEVKEIKKQVQECHK